MSTVAGVPEAACAVFTRVPFTARDLPLAELVASMNKGDLVREGVELLARIPEPPNSSRMLACLLGVGSKQPLAALTLCRIANNPKGAGLFLQNTKWLVPDTLPVGDAVILWLTLAQHPDCRAAFVGIPEFPAFLGWAAVAGTERELEAIVPVVRRLQISAGFAQAIDQAGFVQSFLLRCLGAQNAVLQDAVMLFIDKIGRVCWLAAFELFIKVLPGRFQGDALSGQKALVCAMVLAKHPESWGFFKEANLKGLVQQCPVEKSHEGYKQNLLNFLDGLG
jgi:hypothetical protein